MTAPLIRSRAEVVTDAPARYAKQLVSHLGRKVGFTTGSTPEGATSTAQIAGATAQVVVGEDVLVLLASGQEERDVARVEHVLGSHLERFATRSELTVTWTREDPR